MVLFFYRYHEETESCKCAGARASRYAYIIADFCCQSYGIRPIEGGHLPWGISIKSVVYDYNTKSKPQEHQPLQKIHFIADSISDRFARMNDLPIISQTNTNSKFSLDLHHVLYPFLEDEETMQFAVPEKIFDGKYLDFSDLTTFQVFCLILGKKEKYVPPKRPEISAHIPMRKATLDSAQTDESNAFFDNVTSHVVHDFKYPKWNRGGEGQRSSGENTPKMTTDHESFQTADESIGQVSHSR